VTSFAIRDAVDDLPRLAVIDVGVLGAAQWIHWRFLSERAIGTLTGFDPDPGACARCNMQAPPGIAYLPGLVADGNPVRLHRTRDPRYTSVFRPNTAFASAFEGLAEACQVERVERLDSIRLADVSLPVGAGCDYLRVEVRREAQYAGLEPLTAALGAAIAQAGARSLDEAFAALDAAPEHTGEPIPLWAEN
jgi:hypothetical protein